MLFLLDHFFLIISPCLRVFGEEKMDSDGENGQKTEEKIQEETLEKMDSDGDEGQKTEEKIQGETSEMESKNEKGKKRETKIQEELLEIQFQKFLEKQKEKTSPVILTFKCLQVLAEVLFFCLFFFNVFHYIYLLF